jgi:gamma-glutamyltranspeptidase
VLNVVEPQASGIGGGLFGLLYVDGEVKALDGREEAPENFHGDVYCADADCSSFMFVVQLLLASHELQSI